MADTGSYFVAAYVIVGVVYAGYAASIFRRAAAVRARRAQLEAAARPAAGRERQS